MVRRTKEDADATRNSLLDAAERVFYEKGVARASLSEIARAAGATALKAPEKVFWGGYSGYWADPDGHVWEVAMNPFWPLAEDGSLTLP